MQEFGSDVGVNSPSGSEFGVLWEAFESRVQRAYYATEVFLDGCEFFSKAHHTYWGSKLATLLCQRGICARRGPFRWIKWWYFFERLEWWSFLK